MRKYVRNTIQSKHAFTGWKKSKLTPIQRCPMSTILKALLKMKETPTPKARDHNVGESDYAKHKIQPWDIWLEYRLNPWDADIIKRVLRTKPGQRRLDYEKIKHICDERIRQIDAGLPQKDEV